MNKNIIFIYLVIFFFSYCKTITKVENVNDFKYLNWYNQVKYIENFKLQDKKRLSYNIYIHILTKLKYNAVIIAALQYNLKFSQFNNPKNYFNLLDNVKQPVVIELALKNLYKIKILKTDLHKIIPFISYKDGFVKQQAYMLMRQVNEEKLNKKYYFKVLSQLNTRDIDVLQEVLKTLNWYNDLRMIPYLHKRSYTTKSNIELITLIKTLKIYRRIRIIKSRLIEIVNSHPNYFVKLEARKALY